MPHNQPNTTRSRRDQAAILLMLLGLLGLIRHLSTEPATDPLSGPPVAPFKAKAPEWAHPFNPSTASATPLSDAPDLRRRLREFIIPLPGIIHQLPADALALLQHF